MSTATTPYRPLPVVQPGPVYCLHCVHRVTRRDYYRHGVSSRRNDCKMRDQMSRPDPVTGASWLSCHTTCAEANKNRDCADFSEKPLTWWERIVGRRYP